MDKQKDQRCMEGHTTYSIFLRIYSSTVSPKLALLVYFAHVLFLINCCMQRMVALSGRWINDVMVEPLLGLR